VIGQLIAGHRSVGVRNVILDLLSNRTIIVMQPGWMVQLIRRQLRHSQTAIIREVVLQAPHFHVHFTPTYGS